MFMTHFIKIGGIAIIAAVLGIFAFIFSQILPLFSGAEIKEQRSITLPQADHVILGVDEWSERPFVVDRKGQVLFIDAASGKIEAAPMDFIAGKEISAVSYKPSIKALIFGSADGSFLEAHVEYEPIYEGETRRIAGSLKPQAFIEIGKPGLPIRKIDIGETESAKLVAAIQEDAGALSLHAILIARQRSLFGPGEEKIAQVADLTAQLPAKPIDLHVNAAGDAILVSCENGEVVYFQAVGGEIRHWQTFTPFKDRASAEIRSMDFLFGDVSVVFTNGEGLNRVFSLYIPEGEDKRTFGLTKEFKKIEGSEPIFYAPSLRNKSFLIGSGSLASLRYATTEKVRWEKKLPFQVSNATISGKYNRILFLDTENKLHFYDLKDPHPESSFSAFFGKLWYEGQNRPDFSWQSTGGTDDFEPKLSLVPLIIGTLKGTLYALLFAVPIALVAALYTSQFLHPKLRMTVKPVMEIMASLPSVVLGFLSALWLAPLIETKVPSVLLLIICLPLTAFFAGWAFSSSPRSFRDRFTPGLEFLVIAPLMVLVAVGTWQAGPWIEKIFFEGDFRFWWPRATGTPFEQRNSLVVGFMMGFAVIPIIFTITEDSLSNVPSYLKSASLALGASRWQMALSVVLPTASAGIFSALMVGFGRAVGETMIVVMATGNTPIMDFNIFSGMRTLSANIAVELPEAPHHGTLFRTLYLGAMLLFMLTFLVNTIAEILRQRLREKYRTV